jgi:ABC-type transport system involved in multi-copper enzyme maturation permease subunit
MVTLWAIALITFKEGFRSRVLLGIVIMALFIFLGAVLFTGLFMQDIVKVAIDFCLSGVSFAGLLLTLFLGTNLIAKDLERKTIQAILSRAISRSQYVVGKFLGLSLLIGAAMILLGVLAAVFVLWIAAMNPQYGTVNWALFSLSVFSTTGMLILLVAASLFFASLTSGSYIAVMLTILFYIIGISSENIRNLIQAEAEFLKVSPVISRVVDITYYIFPNLAAFDFKTQAAHGLPVSAEVIGWLGLYAAFYIFALIVMTTLVFRWREFP